MKWNTGRHPAVINFSMFQTEKSTQGPREIIPNSRHFQLNPRMIRICTYLCQYQQQPCPWISSDQLTTNSFKNRGRSRLYMNWEWSNQHVARPSCRIVYTSIFNQTPPSPDVHAWWLKRNSSGSILLIARTTYCVRRTTLLFNDLV